ncbi:hypothetical protein KFE25_008616 [Diacronema lutheri]|uniref:Uncharacterized protein n=3 Tax=Diacronema lutheri TaxID=2081491 RepID=A0A8J6CHH1_DIALT|nr:hypothetical protein KFE25_008616 [Diacronema lutheri]
MATAPAPPPPGKKEEEEEDEEDEGSAMLLEAVTKDEWKTIEGALLPQRRAVCEMLTRVCTQIRVSAEKPADGKKERGDKSEAKKDVVFDDNIGRFLVDMLPEMDGFAEWIYSNHIRPKLESMGLDLPSDDAGQSDGKEDKKGGGGKKSGGGGGGGKKDKAAKEVKIPAKVQIKLDNIVRIMQGESANTTKMAGKRGNLGDRSVGWLEGLQPERPLANDAPWELQLAREMAAAGALLHREASKAVGFAAIRNLSDAIMTYEAQFRIRFDEAALRKALGSRLLTDARHVLGKVKDAVSFEADECLRSYAHLLSSSEFRKRHAAKFLQPYPTQLELFRQLLQPGPQLVLLRSPPDTGKTSVAPTLAELFPDHRVVFCCLARRVNLEIAQILYNQGIPFAWVHNSLVTCSWLCGLRGASTSSSIEQMEQKLRDGVERQEEAKLRMRKRRAPMPLRPPRMFVTDVMSAGWLLRQLPPANTVLMLDEPTMGSDQSGGEAQPDNSITGCMVAAMLASPVKAVWCSATLPSRELLPSAVGAWRKAMAPLCKEGQQPCINEIVSMQLNVGSLLVRPNGRIAAPHQLCSSVAELRELVSRVRSEPLLLKAYTAQAVVDLNERLARPAAAARIAKAGVSVQPLNDAFRDPSMLTHASIRDYALRTLDALHAAGDDELVRAVCSAEGDGDVSGPPPFPPFGASALLTSTARFFMGMTLTVSTKPTAQLQETADELVGEMPSLKELSKEVELHEANLERQINAVRKEVEKAAKGAPDRMEELMAQRMRELDMSIGVEKALRVPEHTIVNSRAHVRHYALKGGMSERQADELLKSIDPSFFRHMPKQSELTRISIDLLVEDRWKLLLLAGVGAHAPHSAAVNPQGNTSYTHYVGEQMEKGALSVCAVTKDFTYGANVPCTSVLVEKAFSSSHSANTLRQFIGRVARTGLASFGVAQFEDDAALHKLFMQNDNLEALVMEATAAAQIERSQAPAA